MTVGEAYNLLYTGALIVLAILIGVMLIRSILGPGVTDRILSINMIGTMVVACIAILAAYLAESYLLDVALIYTMISFVTVLILASVYIPANPKRHRFIHEEESGGSSPGVMGEKDTKSEKKTGGRERKSRGKSGKKAAGRRKKVGEGR